MSRKAPVITIRELRLPDEAALLYPLIKQLNPDLLQAEYSRRLDTMIPQGYRCVGAWKAKKLIGAMGLWSATRFWCGKYIEADNFVVDQSQRSQGIGALFSDWLEAEAKRLKCNVILADSFTKNHASHRFYLRERYDLMGFSFVKRL